MISRLPTASLVFFLLILGTIPAFAASLAWDPPGGIVTGYRIYYGTMLGQCDRYVNVGNVTTYPINKMPFQVNTLYYIVVKAYNRAGESDASNYVEWFNLPNQPIGLIEVLKVLLIEE